MEVYGLRLLFCDYRLDVEWMDLMMNGFDGLHMYLLEGLMVFGWNGLMECWIIFVA